MIVLTQGPMRNHEYHYQKHHLMFTIVEVNYGSKKLNG